MNCKEQGASKEEKEDIVEALRKGFGSISFATVVIYLCYRICEYMLNKLRLDTQGSKHLNNTDQ